MYTEVAGPSSPHEVSLMEPVPPSSPPARPWRLSVPVSLGVLLLLTSLVIAAMSLRSHARPSSAPAATAATPADGLSWCSLGYVDIEGGVTPLYPAQPGRVRSIDSRENEAVKAGDPLFHLDEKVPQLKVREAKAAVEAAQEQLKAAQSAADALDKKIAAQKEAIEIAEIEVKRACALRDEKQRLYEKTIGTEFEVVDAGFLVEKAQKAVRGERAKLAALEALKEKAEGAVAMAHADLKGKQALLAEAENAVNECVVRAPVDGTPLRILVNVGQVLGSNPRQPAIQFAAQEPLLVRAEVEQEFVGRVRKGQNVVIEDHVTGQVCARGKVASIADWYAPRRTASLQMLSMNSDDRTLECIIQIESTESTSRKIRIGQRVRVRFPELTSEGRE